MIVVSSWELVGIGCLGCKILPPQPLKIKKYIDTNP
jgi:hypothetical protein